MKTNIIEFATCNTIDYENEKIWKDNEPFKLKTPRFDICYLHQ